MQTKRWCAALMVVVMLTGLLAPYTAPRAHAAANETSTFMFQNATTFAGPNLDMVQGYTPAGASTSCPGALGNNWTCTWSSDTFATGQTMAAGTTNVNLYAENNVSTIVPRAGFTSAGVTPATITYRTAGALATINGGDLGPVGLPAGTQPDDLLLMIVEVRDITAPVLTIISPAGWNKLYENNNTSGGNGSNSRAALFWKRMGNPVDASGPTIDHAGTALIMARIISFYNVDWVTGPFDATTSASTGSGADQTVEAAGITTVTEWARLVFVAHMSDNHASIALPAGWTQMFFSPTTTGVDGAISAHYSNLMQALPWPAVTGTVTYQTVAPTSAAAVSNGAQLALRPKPQDLSLGRPASTLQNDVMIASIALRSTNAAITAPAGWTPVRRMDNPNSTINSLAVYYKVAGDPAIDTGPYVWQFSPAAHAAGGIKSYGGVDTADLATLIENGRNTPVAPDPGTEHRTPELTTTVANMMLVASYGVANPDTWTCPTCAMTEAFDQLAGTASESVAQYYSDPVQAVPGLTGEKKGVSSSADFGNAHILALRPAARTATLTVQLLHNAAVIGSTTVNVGGPANPALFTASFATSAVTFADGDRLHVRVIAPNDAVNVNARVWFDGASQQSRLVTPALSCTTGEPTYVAATAQNGQVVLYWSSPNPALILEKAGAAVTETPVNHTAYSAGAPIGAATVVYSGTAAATSFTKTGLTNGTTYHYKVFPKNGATCYAAGTAVNGAPSAGPRPSWSYMMAGGSMLKAGIAGMGSLYTASNANRIVSLETATGLQTWSPVATNQPVQGWLSWVPNNGYTSRQTITITAGAAAVPTGYSVPITLDHASLVAAGKSRANGDDVRVVYWNGANGVELDRVLDSGSAWNTPSTKVWFKTQAAIGASGSDSSYYVYYGNALAANPPANAANVFLFHDDFSGAAIDASKWAVTRGSVTVAGGELTLNATTSIRALAAHAFGTATRWDARMQLSGDGTSQYFNYHTPSDQDGYTGAWVAFWTDNTTTYVETATAPASLTRTAFTPSTPTAYHTYRIDREGTTNVRFFQDATQVGSIGTTVPTGNLRPFIWNDTALTIKLDWYTVRQYVTPEPATALAPQESQTWGSIIGGDQSGRLYSVDAVTGATNWTADLSAQADAIQAGIAVQMRTYSDGSFQGAYTTDVIFAASRNTTATNCGTAATNNKLFARRADTGAYLWTFNETCTQSIDYIVGMPYVDYARNRVYLATRGTGSTLWILDSLNGNVIQQLALGNLDTSPALSWDSTTIYVGSATGTFWAVDATTFTTTSVALGSAVKSVIWEDWSTPGRMYFTTMNGTLWCLQNNGGSFSTVWTMPLAGASTPLLLDKLYVGASDGRLHQFDLDGTNEKVFPTVGTLDGSAVGDVSTEDWNHVFVGTNGGKLFKIQVPLP